MRKEAKKSGWSDYHKREFGSAVAMSAALTGVWLLVLGGFVLLWTGDRDWSPLLAWVVYGSVAIPWGALTWVLFQTVKLAVDEWSMWRTDWDAEWERDLEKYGLKEA